MNSATDSHTADALREILATCADPLNRACEEYAKLARELAEAQDIAAELITERARRSFEDRMSASSETRRSIPIADIERQIEDITKNGISLAKFGGDEAVEGRCRELCAMYLREFILTHRMSEQLAELDKPETSAPCVARRAVEEIKAIIQKHVPLPGWAYEDEIVRVVRECERSGA